MLNERTRVSEFSIQIQQNKLTRNYTIAAVCYRFYSAREDRRWPSNSDYYTSGDRLSCAILIGLPVNCSMKTKLASLTQNLIHTACWLQVLWKTYTRTHGVIPQKTIIFVDTGIRTSNITCLMECYNKNPVTFTVINTGTVQDYIFFWRNCPQLAMTSFTRFLDHTQRRNTVGRTSLYEWSARHRDLYLTTHNTHKRQTSVPPVGFEPTIPAGERPQTYVLDRAVTGTRARWYNCMILSEALRKYFLEWYLSMKFSW